MAVSFTFDAVKFNLFRVTFFKITHLQKLQQYVRWDPNHLLIKYIYLDKAEPENTAGMSTH